MKNEPMKTVSLKELTNKFIGEIGTPKREVFENELRLDLIDEAISKPEQKSI